MVGHAVKTRDEIQVLRDGEVFEQAWFVGNERDLPLRGDRIRSHVETAQARAAERGRDDAGEAAQRRGLARPVRPNQTHHLAWADAERQVIDCSEVAVALGEVGNVDHGRILPWCGWIKGQLSQSGTDRGLSESGLRTWAGSHASIDSSGVEATLNRVGGSARWRLAINACAPRWITTDHCRHSPWRGLAIARAGRTSAHVMQLLPMQYSPFKTLSAEISNLQIGSFLKPDSASSSQSRGFR